MDWERIPGNQEIQRVLTFSSFFEAQESLIRTFAVDFSEARLEFAGRCGGYRKCCLEHMRSNFCLEFDLTKR